MSDPSSESWLFDGDYDWDLDSEEDLSWRDTNNGALHRAAQYGSVELVSFLLHNGWGYYVNASWEEHSNDVKSRNRRTPLWFAVTGGNAGIVALLLQNGARPLFRGGDQIPPFFLATRQGRADLVDIFLQHGADARDLVPCSSVKIGERVSDDAQPIHVAASMGHLSVIDLLLQHGAHVDDQPDGSATALHFACENNSLQVVKYLVKKSAALDKQNGQGMTPLNWACAHRNVRVANYLIRKGADVCIEDTWGMTPLLHIMYRSRNINLIRKLIRHGASVHSRSFPYRWSPGGDPPIHLALQPRPNLKLIRLLLRHGADINAINAEGGNTPLHIASKLSLRYMEFFIKNGADVLAKNSVGNLPIHLAAERAGSSGRELEYLVKMDPYSDMINCSNSEGTTPLHYAASRNAVANVRLLLASGADANAWTPFYGTPLHTFARCQSKFSSEDELLIAKYLIKHGANVHAITEQGATPLHYAAGRSQDTAPHVVDLLIQHGADVLAKDSSGRGVLRYASGHSAANLIPYLAQSGADVNEIDHDGLTVLNFVALHRDTRLIQALLNHGADPSLAASDPRLTLHYIESFQPPPRQAAWMLLRAANRTWLEPSCKGLPPKEIPHREVAMQEREKLFLSEFLPKTPNLGDTAAEVQVRSVAKSIWQNIAWVPYDPKTSMPDRGEEFFRKWKPSIEKLQQCHDLLVNRLPGGVSMYFRLIIEIGAAYDIPVGGRDRKLPDEVTLQFNFLEQLAVTNMLEHYSKLSSNDMWSLMQQSAADAEIRCATYPGRYFGRWRRLMSDILRTRNLQIKVGRALDRYPPEITKMVLEAVMDLEDIPRESEWGSVWGHDQCAIDLLGPEIEGDDYFNEVPRADILNGGTVVFDPISRKFAWLSTMFGGGVYYGFEPTFLFDNTQQCWVANEKHFTRFGKLMTWFDNDWSQPRRTTGGMISQRG